MANLIFKDAEEIKLSIMETQQQEIKLWYDRWADDIHDMALYYGYKTAPSYALKIQQLNELEAQLRAQSQELSNQIYNKITENMYIMADAVVSCNNKWLESLGFPASGITASFHSIPTMAVQNLITGNVYESGWSLSSRIWGDNETTMKDIYTLVAMGLAENSSIYDIAKNLEAYVRPGAALPWNLQMKDGVKIYKKQVDYNAQRLARTLVQHTYQQTFVATTINNPLIEDYIWHANGSRVCELCEERDGQHFKKDELPLDHPNGMCVMEPNVDMDKAIDRLADWVNSPDGTDPELDEFSKNFGYTPQVAQFTPLQQQWLGQFGYTPQNMPASFSEWSHQLSNSQASEILKMQGSSWNSPHPYQDIKKWYDQNLAKLQVPGQLTPDQQFVAKYGPSLKSPSAWYNGLTPEMKAEAKALKESSGLTWNEWYWKNVYAGDPAQAQAAAAAAKNAGGSGKAVTYSGGAFQSYADWIRGVQNNTERYMLDLEKDSLGRLTRSQESGLRDYTGSGYDAMNEYLRYKGWGYSDAEAKRMSNISDGEMRHLRQAIEALRSTSIGDTVYLRRGGSYGELAGFISTSKEEYREYKREFSNMTPDELNQRFAGSVFTYNGFTSTSSIWSRGFSGNVEVIYYAPAETMGSSIMTISSFGTSEGETLLAPGTQVRIDHIEQSDGHKGSEIRVFAEIIGNTGK